MAKFGCRDVSTLLVDTRKREATRKHPAREQKKFGRKNPAKAHLHHDDLAQAKKKEMTKEKQDDIELERKHGKEVIRAFKKKGQSLVWVGNLQSRMTEPRLASIFSRKCGGRVLSVELRRSGGQAVTKGQEIPKECRSEKDTLYASIQFSKHESAKKALLYHGAILDDVPIVVATQPVAMPEQRHILEEQRKRQRARLTKTLEGTTIINSKPLARPLKCESTLLLATDWPPCPKIDDKMHIGGVSFALTIM